MTNGQPQKLKAGADHGGPTAAEKAAQRRAEQRARKAEERASKRMCTPGGLNSNFLGDLCSGLPFCTQSRDASHSRDGFQHDGGGSPNGAKRSKPKAPWSFGAERVQADSHSGGWAVPGTNWGFGGNGNGNGGGNSGGGGGGFNFTPPGWSPGSHATPGGGGGGFFGLGAPPQKSEDEAMIDDLLESQSKQEGDRGLWSLVTDLFNPGSHNNAPHGAPQQPPGEMSPYEVPPHQLPPPHQNGSAGGEVSGFSSTAADGSSFDDLVDMDVALGFEGVQLHADAAPNSAIPPRSQPRRRLRRRSTCHGMRSRWSSFRSTIGPRHPTSFKPTARRPSPSRRRRQRHFCNSRSRPTRTRSRPTAATPARQI